MKFLYILISSIWILYAAVCMEALKWEPPIPPPWHAARAMQSVNPQALDQSIEQNRLQLAAVDATTLDKVGLHYKLSYAYWLKAYFQGSLKTQTAYLRLSLMESLAALKIAPEDPQLLYCAADIYHQMRDYENAELYYTKSLERDPASRRTRRRYHEMQLERDKIVQPDQVISQNEADDEDEE